MAVELATAYVTLVPSLKGSSKNIAKELSGGEFKAAGEKGGSGIGSAIASGVKKTAKFTMAAAGIAVGAALTGGIRRALSIEDAQAKLEGLGHSSDTVAKIMDNALAAVKGTAFGLGDAAGLAATMAAAGIKPGEQMETTLKRVADSATIAGVDLSDMGLIWGKAAAKGKVNGQIINQMLERQIPILDILGDHYGKTAEEVSKMVSDGEVSFEAFSDAMDAKVGGAALRSGDTTRGAFANMLAAVSRIGEKLISGVFPKIAGVFTGITGLVDKLAPSAEKVGEVVGVAFERIGAAALGVFEILKTGNFSGQIREALGVEEDSALVGGLLTMRDKALGAFSEIRGGMYAMIAGFQDGGHDVTSSGLAGFMESLGLAAKNLWDAVGPVAKDLGPAFLEMMSALSPLKVILDGITPVLPQIATALGQVAAAVGGALAASLPAVAEAFTQVGGALAGAISEALPHLVPLIESVADVIPTLTPALLAVVPLVTSLAMAVLDLVLPLLSSENGVKALVVGLIAWKVAIAGIALAKLIGALGKSTIALAKNTIGWIRNTAAAIASKAQTVAIAALYAGSFLASVARSTAGWVANTASMVANKVAMVASTVASKAAVAAQAAMRVAQLALNAAMRANPIGLIITAITALVAALVWFFTKTEVGKKIIETAWSGIKAAIGFVADWWTQTAWPAIKKGVDVLVAVFKTYQRIVTAVWSAVWGAISKAWNWIRDKVFAAIRTQIAGLRTIFAGFRTVIETVWKGIQSAIRVAWEFIRDRVFSPIRSGVDLVTTGFRTARDGITGAWGAVETALKKGWDFIRDKIFDPINKGVDLVKKGFENAKDGIATAWGAIKEITAKPVNFVLGTVYNDGIRNWWNKIAGALNLDSLKMPEAKLVKFAQGSEDHRAQIAPPGAMRLWAEPETGGEAYIPLAQSKRSRSTAILAKVADRFGYNLTTFAGGGFWDKVGSVGSKLWNGAVDLAGDVWEGAKRAGKFALDFLDDPAKAVTNELGNVVRGLLDKMPGGDFAKMVAQVPIKFVGEFAKSVKSLVTGEKPPPAESTQGGRGMGWQAQVAVAKNLLPWARVTSTYRAGATTAGSGNTSMHALGRAIDLAGGSMAKTFNALDKAYGNRSSELLYSPMGSRQILRGGRRGDTSGVTKDMHYNHVHWAMANGGLLYDQGGWIPHGGVGVNLSGKPEAVLTPDESAALKAGVASGPLVDTMIVRDERAAIEELERMQRRELTRRRITGVPR